MFLRMPRHLLPSRRRTLTFLNVPDVDKEKWAPIDHYIAEKYALINGALIYMSITCRPDTTYAIGKTSRGMHQPTPAHVASDRSAWRFNIPG